MNIGSLLIRFALDTIWVWAFGLAILLLLRMVKRKPLFSSSDVINRFSMNLKMTETTIIKANVISDPTSASVLNPVARAITIKNPMPAVAA